MQQVERDLIARLLQSGRVKQAVTAGLEAKHFSAYKAEWKFVKRHFDKYNEAPSVSVFKDRFPDYKHKRVSGKDPSIRPAVDAVKANFIEREVGKIIEKAAKKIGSVEPSELLDFCVGDLEKLQAEDDGEVDIDIIDTAFEDVTHFKKLQNPDELEKPMSIPSPWDAMERRMGGFVGGQVIGVIAGTNEGKSWISTQIAAWAAYKGFRPFIAPLEMSRHEVAQRVHTMLSYWLLRDGKMDEEIEMPKVVTKKSMEKFFNGDAGKHIFRNTHLSMGSKKIDVDEYEEWAHKLREFIPSGIYLPRESNAPFTFNRFARHCEKSECDIAILDYLTLLEDENGRMSEVEKWASITRKTKRLAQKLDIPIVVCAQANRKALEAETPELHHVHNSHAFSQDCNTILSIKNKGSRLNVTCIKSRGSKNRFRFFLHFYPDYGIIEQDMKAGVVEDIEVGE